MLQLQQDSGKAETEIPQHENISSNISVGNADSCSWLPAESHSQTERLTICSTFWRGLPLDGSQMGLAWLRTRGSDSETVRCTAGSSYSTVSSQNPPWAVSDGPFTAGDARGSLSTISRVCTRFGSHRTSLRALASFSPFASHSFATTVLPVPSQPSRPTLSMWHGAPSPTQHPWLPAAGVHL